MVSGDLGFRGFVASLKLVTLKDTNATPLILTDDTNYLALELSGLNATLVGLDALLEFNAWNINVLVNQASDTDGLLATNTAKLDFGAFDEDPGSLLLPNFSSALNASIDIGASGSVSLNVLSGLLVAKATFALSLGQVSGTDTTTTLVNAQALLVTLSNVDLWVGPGGDLDNNNTPIDVTDTATFADDTVVSGDLGFRGFVGSLKLATLKDLGDPAVTTDDISYLGLEVNGLNATLVGLEALLEFNAWNINVLVNQVSATDPTATPTKLDFGAFVAASGSLLLPNFSTALNASIDIGASGSVTLNALSGLVVAKAMFAGRGRAVLLMIDVENQQQVERLPDDL